MIFPGKKYTIIIECFNCIVDRLDISNSPYTRKSIETTDALEAIKFIAQEDTEIIVDDDDEDDDDLLPSD